MIPSKVGSPGVEWVVAPCPECGAGVWSFFDKDGKAKQKRACQDPCGFKEAKE